MALKCLCHLSAARVPPLSTSEESRKSCTVGMATVVLTLLSSAWFPLDLSAHQDALILAGNLLAGTGTNVRRTPRSSVFEFLLRAVGGECLKEKCSEVVARASLFRLSESRALLTRGNVYYRQLLRVEYFKGALSQASPSAGCG